MEVCFVFQLEKEVKLAELISKVVPCAEMTRLVGTGSEATMNAIRLARAFSRKKRVIKFEGCYHGAHDYVLVKAGSAGSRSSNLRARLKKCHHRHWSSLIIIQ